LHFSGAFLLTNQQFSWVTPKNKNILKFFDQIIIFMEKISCHKWREEVHIFFLLSYISQLTIQTIQIN